MPLIMCVDLVAAMAQECAFVVSQAEVAVLNTEVNELVVSQLISGNPILSDVAISSDVRHLLTTGIIQSGAACSGFLFDLDPAQVSDGVRNISGIAACDPNAQIVISPNSRFAYISTIGPNGHTVAVIDADTMETVTPSIVIRSDVERGQRAGLAVDPRGQFVLAAGFLPAHANGPLDLYVDAIDTETNLLRPQIVNIGPIGPGASVSSLTSSIVVSPDGARAYVAVGRQILGRGESQVLIVDTQTLGELDRYELGGSSSDLHIALSPDGRFAYVAGQEEGAVGVHRGGLSVIDTVNHTVVVDLSQNCAAGNTLCGNFGPVGLTGDGRLLYTTLFDGDFFGLLAFSVAGPTLRVSAMIPDMFPTALTIRSVEGACPPPQPPLSCVGDCDVSGAVIVNELITIVNIALGNTPLSACTAGDADGSGDITINEIIAAVNNALTACPAS